ncbi:MAG: M20/M25/M40 family metallo-hydrolase, partial [Bacteroidales bacterium]
MNLNTKEINNKPPLVNYPDPEDVYSLFKQINRVPRPSWHEEKIVIFLQQFAAAHSLECVATDSSCVVIKKRATQGYENAPIIVLLNHIDMVCVAEEGKKFDPLNDPIESYTDNGWIKANGTSLGADNGIGMAMALAILQSRNIIHGPLECIFTANEEDGMTGAATLSPDFLSGRLIINLDSEDYDTITIGSAAAYLQFTTLHVTREKGEPDYCYLKLNIKGGNGGHSGVDINKGRANANKLIGEFIYQQSKKHDVKLLAFNGGEANNSIPVNAEVTVGIPTLYKDQF